MAKEYSREQFWQLYEKLPQELKETIFSEETAENIFDICIRSGIENEKISEIARYVGRVLLGILSPEEFQGILETELKLKKEKAKKIAQEINRFVFYPVKSSLEGFYKIEITPSAEVTPPSKITPPTEEKPPTPPKKDVYREPIG